MSMLKVLANGFQEALVGLIAALERKPGASQVHQLGIICQHQVKAGHAQFLAIDAPPIFYGNMLGKTILDLFGGRSS